MEPGKRLMRQVAAWVTPDEHALINRLADENGCSVSTLLRGALIHHFGFTPVEDRPERRGDV